MVKIDLITGFLGAGKTTFIRKYAEYLMDKGLSIGILENDYGAVNVDMMLLQDMSGDNCELEMVAGGCDYDCHRRRFKTKLISMGMCGYDRVIVEPSGIYDVDEFFDVLHEEPLDNWYEIGNVITIVDSKLDNDMSVHSDYMLACQLADAGSVILSRTKEADKSDIDNTIVHLNNALKNVRCSRVLDKEIICKDWDTFTEKDYEKILNSGYVMENYTKLFSQDDEGFQSVYYMNKKFTKDELQKIIKEVMDDKKCGNIFRVKGFMKISDNSWIQLNATHNEIRIEPIDKGQEVIIIIGEELDKQRLDKHFM
jgi:G3E family GTPase